MWASAVTSVVVAALLSVGAPTLAASPGSPLDCGAGQQPVSSGYDYGQPARWRIVGESVADPEIWTGHRVGQMLLADGEALYAGYYDADRRLTIAYRPAPDEPWTRYRVPGEDALVGWDSHNRVALGVDRDGQLHVAANMHADELRYWRTTRAGDLTSLTRVGTMVRRQVERSVTYPAFISTPGGDLVFHYREGGSRGGATYLNRYDPARQTWRAVTGGPLLDGVGGPGDVDRSPYPEISTTPTEDGFYEAVWVWRDAADATTNSRLSYLRSRDLEHWESVDGTPVELPVRYDTPGVIVDDIPPGGGILNGAAQVVQTADHPVVVYYKFDEDGNHQLYAARPRSDGTWRTRQLTSWDGRADLTGQGTLAVPIGIRAVQETSRGDVRVDYACGTPTTRASLVLDARSLEVLGQTPTPVAEYPADVYRPVTTDSQATRAATSAVRLGEGSSVVMTWQSQGTNQDRPFDQTSPPLPLRVFDLRQESDLAPPQRLRVELTDRSSQRVALTWLPADGSAGGVRYLVEKSSDEGVTWAPVGAVNGHRAELTARELGQTGRLRFRVSVLTDDGVGRPVVSDDLVAAPRSFASLLFTLVPHPADLLHIVEQAGRAGGEGVLGPDL